MSSIFLWLPLMLTQCKSLYCWTICCNFDKCHVPSRGSLVNPWNFCWSTWFLFIHTFKLLPSLLWCFAIHYMCSIRYCQILVSSFDDSLSFTAKFTPFAIFAATCSFSSSETIFYNSLAYITTSVWNSYTLILIRRIAVSRFLPILMPFIKNVFNSLLYLYLHRKKCYIISFFFLNNLFNVCPTNSLRTILIQNPQFCCSLYIFENVTRYIHHNSV